MQIPTEDNKEDDESKQEIKHGRITNSLSSIF